MFAKLKLIWLSLFLVLVIGCTGIKNDMPIDCSKQSRTFVPHDNGNLLWSLSDVYVIPANLGNGVLLATTPEILFTVARTSDISRVSLFAYDANSGERLWEKPTDLPALLATYEAKLYLGLYDKVEVYEGNTEESDEEIVMPEAGNILSIYPSQDRLFVYGGSGKFFTYDMTTKSVSSIASDFVTRSFLVEEGILYFHKGKTLGALDIRGNVSVWEVDIQEPFTNPNFSDDMIFIRTGNPINPGSIYAIDKNSGNIAWKKNINVISNLEVKDHHLFFMVEDGHLFILDRNSGEEVARFEFKVESFTTSPLRDTIGGYYVTFDSENKIIYSSFGDSCQIFAISIK